MSDMPLPLVSVGLPVFNGTSTIRRALDSLLAQTYGNMEIIISDNASTDDTHAICREYAARDARIRLVRQESNIGIIGNFGYVLSAASGKYFCWAAADDAWAPGFIERLAGNLESNPRIWVTQSAVLTVRPGAADLAGGRIVRYDGRRNPAGMSRLGLVLSLLSMYKYNYFIYGMYQRETISAAYRQMVNIPSADRWLLLQLVLGGGRFGYVDEPLYIRTVNELSFSARNPGDSYANIKYEASVNRISLAHLRKLWGMIVGSSLISRPVKLLAPLVLALVALSRLEATLFVMSRNFARRHLSEKAIGILKRYL